jgi:hypothetical protein
MIMMIINNITKISIIIIIIIIIIISPVRIAFTFKSLNIKKTICLYIVHIQCVPLAGSLGKCWFTKGAKVQYIHTYIYIYIYI